MVIKNLLEFLFPSNIYCISCGSIIDRSRAYALCDTCVRMFQWANGRTCAKCGKILQETYPHGICVDCRENPRMFDKGYTCVQYGIHERDLLLSFKYGGKTFIGEKIADVMTDRIRGEGLEADIIIPVPMYAQKQKERGYNQVEIICRHLSKAIAVPYSGRVLVRKDATAAMSKLTSFERRMNIENAFAVNVGAVEKIAGKRVLLVDDIYTTGSTADACSRVLADSGASAVLFISFAAGANLLKWDKEASQVCG